MRRIISRVEGTSITALKGSADTPCSVAASQQADIASQGPMVYCDGRYEGPGRRMYGSRLMRAWWPTVTAAEFAGFAVPAGIGALTADLRPAIAIPALLAAGAVEGGMLGWGQASVLRRALPGLPGRRWTVATAIAAVQAYMLGLVPSTFHDSITSWPMPIIVAGAVVLGTALLASIGTAQWLVLRHHVAGAGQWIAATALAWAVGLGVFLGFAMPLWQPGQPTGLVVVIGVGGGLLMAATMSAITGLALRRLLDRQPYVEEIATSISGVHPHEPGPIGRWLYAARRRMYRGDRPGRLAQDMNWMSAVQFSAGLLSPA